MPAARPEGDLADPLAASLAAAAKRLGRPISVAALVAGLPLEAGRLTPALAGRAVERAGLVARTHATRLAEIPELSLPAVLLLADRGACVLIGRDAKEATVLFTGSGELARTLPLAELEALYAGRAILLGTAPGFRAETPTERAAETHHWFWGTLTRSWRLYGEVAAATVVINIFVVLSPLFFMNVYDRVVPNQAFETLWVLALGIGVVYLFDLLLKALRGYFVDLAGKRSDLALSSALYAQVMDIRLDEPRQSVGSLANNLREFESLREFFTSATVSTLIDLPFIFLFVAVIWMIGGPLMALVPLVAIPVVVIAGLILQVPLRDRIRRLFRAAEAKHAAIIETLAAIEMVKSLGAASHLQRKWEEMVAYVAAEGLVTRFLSSFAIHLSAFVQLSVSVGVLVVGVYRFGDGALTVGGLIACTIIAGRALAPLAQVAGLMTRYHQAMSALDALNRIMLAPVERPRGRQFVHRPRLSGELQFRDVEFRYPGSEVNALNGLNFTLRAGERAAIIGRVGSGKSTVLKLVAGLYAPTAGSVLLDGTDLRAIDPTDLRRNLGYLPQNLVLLSGSVRENIVLGAPHVDDSAILRAADLSGLNEFVGRHPRGFDLAVGERGEALSGGQRQQVALARALLLDPPILILDEPTHAMDRASEERLKARLATDLAGRTLLLVTHRESMLSVIDTLIVVDGGRVVAQGPKEQVVRALADGRLKGAG